MTAIGNKSVAEAATLSFTVVAIDNDADVVTYSSADKPAGSTLDANTEHSAGRQDTTQQQEAHTQ